MEYSSVELNEKIVFTYIRHTCKTYRTKKTMIFYHGNGEMVEVNVLLVELRDFG